MIALYSFQTLVAPRRICDVITKKNILRAEMIFYLLYKNVT